MQTIGHNSPQNTPNDHPPTNTSLEAYLLQQIQRSQEAEKQPPMFLLWMKDFWPIIVFIGASIWWMSGLVTQKYHVESTKEIKTHIENSVKLSEERMRLECRIQIRETFHQIFPPSEPKKKP